jgi:membrane protein
MKNIGADLKHFLHFISVRFTQDRCAEMAASLTFTTLLSLVPLLTITLTLFSAFPVFSEFAGLIKSFLLSNMLPEVGGKMITRYMEQFAESATRLTAVGLVFLGLTAMLMIHNIEAAFNTIWRVSKRRTIMQRILISWALLTLAPLLVGGSLSLSSWLIGMSTGYAKQIPAFGIMLLKVMPVMLTTLAFSLMFLIVPNRYIPVRHALIGGVVAAAAFESMSSAFAIYITSFNAYKMVYGAFAGIPIFLLWVYLSWFTVLIGAVIAASLSHWRGDPAKKLTPTAQLYYALRVLKCMSESMRTGSVQTLPSLSKDLHLGFDTLEPIMVRLERGGLLRKLAGRGWAVARDADHVQAAELYRLFVYDPAALDAQKHEDKQIHDWLRQMEQQMAHTASLTLRDLFAGSIGQRDGKPA